MTGGAHTVPLDISVAAKAGLAEVNVALVEVLAGRGTVGGALAWATLLTAFLDLSCRSTQVIKVPLQTKRQHTQSHNVKLSISIARRIS